MDKGRQDGIEGQEHHDQGQEGERRPLAGPEGGDADRGDIAEVESEALCPDFGRGDGDCAVFVEKGRHENQV